MVAANEAAEVLDALRGYGWIVLAAVVVWRLYPVIRKRIESEDFSLEIAGQKVSFSSASEQARREIDDLRRKFIALTERLEGPTDEVAEETAAAPEPVTARPPARILWVDDRPENNAFLIKSLRDRGADVVEAASTDEALAELANPRGCDIVISDMGRKERGIDRALAGVDLVRRMREENLAVPVVIYASPDAVKRGGEQALKAGAFAATSSPTELLTMLRIGPTTAFEASVADIVRQRLDATPFPLHRTVDFVAERDGKRIAIEIKNWSDHPTPEQFERVLTRLVAVRERFGFDHVLLITRQGIKLPVGVDPPPWITVLTDDKLASAEDLLGE